MTWSYLVVIVLSASANGFKIMDNVDYKYYPRGSWAALDPTNVRQLQTPVPFVVIHHTYIPAACFTVEQCQRDMRSMQNYHMGLGWGDIGYNFCVGAEGGAYEGRGWNTVGIHAGKANNFSIGICLIGDWRVEMPPETTLETTKSLIADGINKGIISPDYKIIGHKQVMATECPGQALLDYVSKWEHYFPGHVDFAAYKDKPVDSISNK